MRVNTVHNFSFSSKEPMKTMNLHGVDPHIWLDFANAQKMVDNICKAMITKDPNNKGLYITNADDYKLKLEKLDKEYHSALSNCKHRTIINTGHFAFGYLAKRYNLTFVSAYKGFTPDSEPTPRDMAGLIDTIKKSGIKYLYYEEMLSPKVAQVLEKETGAELLSLNGAHNVSKEAMKSWRYIHFDYGEKPRKPEERTPMPVNVITVNNISIRYHSTEVVSDVSFDVPSEGDYLGIVGPNGSGKTTLIRAIFGLVSLSKGEVSIFGKGYQISGTGGRLATFRKRLPPSIRTFRQPLKR